MKNINYLKVVSIFLFLMFFSASLSFAQEQTAEQVKKDVKKACCITGNVKTAKHVLKGKCKTSGCKTTKTEQAEAKGNKHACTDKCKSIGCTDLKAKAQKHICTDACKNDCKAKS